MATILAPFDTYMIGYTARARALKSPLHSSAAITKARRSRSSSSFRRASRSTQEEISLRVRGGSLFELQQFQDVLAILQREGPLAVWFAVAGGYGYILTTT